MRLPPVSVQSGKCLRHIFIGKVLFQQGKCLRFVDDIVCFPLAFFRDFYITQDKDEGFGFTGSKGKVDLVGGDGGPAACDGIAACAFFNRFGKIVSSVGAEKGIAVCVKPAYFGIDGINGVMIASLPVFCFVENCRINDFYLAGIQIPLEILHVIVGIPQTPFNIRKKRD